MRRLVMENLSVGHRRGAVLTGIDLVLNAGESCFLAGPNGAGKTTMIRTICGLLRPVSGRITHNFHRIAYVPQVRLLDRQFPLTVREAVSLGFSLGPAHRWILKILAARRHEFNGEGDSIAHYLDRVGLLEKSGRLIRECSGGELQRMLIARALIREPDFIALDEPMSFLDESGRVEILELLLELNRTRDLTVLLSGHDRGLSREFRTEIRIEQKTAIRIGRKR